MPPMLPWRASETYFDFFLSVWLYQHKHSHICDIHGGYLAGCAFVTFFYLRSFACLCTAEHNVFTLLYPFHITAALRHLHRLLTKSSFWGRFPIHSLSTCVFPSFFRGVFTDSDHHNLREYLANPSHTDKLSLHTHTLQPL